MKLLSIFIIALALTVSIVSIADETTSIQQKTENTAGQSESVVIVNSGGLATFRGAATIDETRDAERLKRVIKDKNPIARNYVHQPPVIPHQTRGYRIDLNSNKCLSCHSWKHARETGATKISLTHFETRDGKTLSDVSPRRYFCLQCHVTQADAAPLVENTFKPVESLGNE